MITLLLYLYLSKSVELVNQVFKAWLSYKVNMYTDIVHLIFT